MPLPTTHRGFEPEDLQRLEQAYNALVDLADDDFHHKCPPDDHCAICAARTALTAIGQILDAKIEGMHPQRMCNLAERIYVELFRKECSRHGGINSGFGLLEHILCPEGKPMPPAISQRDATVATTVVQWLGTNCGMAFVHEAERRIKEERAVREQHHTDRGLGCSPDGWEEYMKKGPLYRAAHNLAADWISVDKDTTGQNMLALQIMEMALAYERYQHGSRGRLVTAVIDGRERVIDISDDRVDYRSAPQEFQDYVRQPLQQRSFRSL